MSGKEVCCMVEFNQDEVYNNINSLFETKAEIILFRHFDEYFSIDFIRNQE